MDIQLFQAIAEQGALVLLAFYLYWDSRNRAREYAEKLSELNAQIVGLRLELLSAQKEVARAKSEAEAASATELRAVRERSEVLALKQLETLTSLTQAISTLREMIAGVSQSLSTQREDRLAAIEKLLRGEGVSQSRV